MTDGSNALTVTLDFAEPLRTATAAVTPKLCDAIAARVSRIAVQVGVSGAVRVDWRVPGRADWIGVSVGTDVCWYPDGLLDRARAYLTDAPEPLSPEKMREWLLSAFQATPEIAIDVVSHACEWIIGLQPEVLIQDELVAARIAARDDGTGGTPLPAAKRRMRALAALRCPIAGAKEATRTVDDTAAEEETIERLVSDACRGSVEIRLGGELHESLTRNGGETLQISDIREALYQELGLFLAGVHVVLDAELRPRGVRYRINVCDTPAFQTPGPEEIVVNDTADRLRLMNVRAIDTLNVTGQPAAITGGEHRELLEAGGLTTWDQRGLVVLGLAEAIRRNAACFVRADLTGMQMQTLARDYPKLVELARARFSDVRVSSVLRDLVAEQVSVRDLAAVLDRLLDLRYANDPLCQHLLLDERYARNAVNNWTIPEIVEFVRAGLRRQLASKFARGTQTVVVYLLSSELEQLVVANELSAEARIEADHAIVSAVRSEIAHLPMTARLPVVLTEGRIRRHVRRILHRTFPALSFASFDELPDHLNVQPVARIDVPPFIAQVAGRGDS